jgi:hypothetical protein
VAFLFRQELASLFNRIEEFSAGGTSVKVKPYEQQRIAASPLEQARDAVENAASEEVAEGQANLSLTPDLDGVTIELDDRGKAVYGPIVRDVIKELRERFDGDYKAQLAAVIRAFAGVSVQKSHEINYRLIFGSQIAALRYLFSSGPSPRAGLFNIYVSAVNAEPKFYENISFESWLYFLVHSNFIAESESDTPSPILHLTPIGADFLHYISANNYSLEKYA